MLHPIVTAAMAALKLDNPIYAYEISADGKTVTLHLCGHIEPAIWSYPSDPADSKRVAAKPPVGTAGSPRPPAKKPIRRNP